MSIDAYATPEATGAFAGRHNHFPATAYIRLGRSELTASRLGFGTYRCHSDIALHQQAIRQALQAGCNVIDTSANYTDGNAEVLIGDMLNGEIVWGERERAELIIVSKAGYIQGENMEIALAREEKEDPFPEVVKYQDGLWHCIHPDFLEDQITRSLARMHLDTLDIYLLHNPEYYLGRSAGSGMPLAEARAIFYERIRRAFVHMEALVAEGLIRYYGISSNGFPLGEDAVDFVSLALVWRAYQDACLQRGLTVEQGHFAAIQLPFNWLETGALFTRNNVYKDSRSTVLELASELDLGVLVNRPLNALQGRQLLRLSERFEHPLIDRLRHSFDTVNPPLAQSSFSQKALAVAVNTPGIQVVLNGMRTPDYVADSMGVMQLPAVNALDVLQTGQ